MPRWTANKGLTLKDMREQHHARIVAERADRPLRGFLTLMPLRSVPAERRRGLFQEQRSRLGQRLARPPFKLDFIGMFVREAKAEDIHDAGEHCAGLLWLPEDIDTDTLLRCLSPEIDAQLDWNNGEAGIKARLDYLQKERCGQAEGYLKKHKRLRYPWEAPAPLTAPRWSATNGLLNLIAADAAEQERRPRVYLGARLPPPTADDAALAEHHAVKAKPPRLHVVVSNPLVPEPVQLSLFPLAERPVSRLSNYGGGVMPPAVAQEIEARRRWRGLTQEALARFICISRPQLTNALQSRFGLSAWAATRLREYLLPTPTQKAAA